MKWVLICVIGLHVFVGQSQVGAWQGQPQQVAYGEIMEVCSQEATLRVRINGQEKILALADDVLILRGKQVVFLESLRPIAAGRYQEGLFFFDTRGRVAKVQVHYHVYEAATELEGVSLLVQVDIFGQVKDVELLFIEKKEFLSDWRIPTLEGR